MTSTNYPAITPTDIEQFKIALPKNRNLIVEQVNKLNSFDDSIIDVKSKITTSQSLQKSLINQIFG